MTEENINAEKVLDESSEQTEENPKKGNPETGFSMEGLDDQINALHDNLDQIKEAGQQIPQEIKDNVPEDADRETIMEAQRLVTRANLLFRRIEHGDKSVVRGE